MFQARIKAVFIFFSFLVLFQPVFSSALEVPTTFWPYQCIDTMKYSRDAAGEWATRKDLQQLVDKQVGLIKGLGANCIALATPYDDEFVPVLSAWVKSARSAGLKVWFRGNMSGWEGWFGRKVFTSVDQHHRGIYHFITTNPSLFQEGDVFTPAPEAENGMLGNPWRSDKAKQELRDFVTASAENCQKAFADISKNISCGYFSANGDVAREIYTPEIIKKTGGVAVIDHYVKSPEKLVSDLVSLSQKQGAKVFLGEFGAPIPDLHGQMTEAEQAAYVETVLKGLVEKHDQIEGVNYWVLSGGSTALYNENGTPRQVVGVIQRYFKPQVLSGTIRNTAGEKLSGMTVSVKGGVSTVTNQDGGYWLLSPSGSAEFSVEGKEYKKNSKTFQLASGQNLQLDIAVEPFKPGVGYWFKKMWHKVFN